MRALTLLGLLTGFCAAAPQDDKKSDKPDADLPPAKVDWGAYTDHVKLAGVVEKVDESRLVLKVVKGVNRGRPPKPVYEEVDLQFHESALVRRPKLPPKATDAGKKANYTPKELAALKQPRGIPGYHVPREELVEGARVEVQLLKPKPTKGAKPESLVTTDYKVKYVVILADVP